MTKQKKNTHEKVKKNRDRTPLLLPIPSVSWIFSLFVFIVVVLKFISFPFRRGEREKNISSENLCFE
jgi:hypothetical protein